MKIALLQADHVPSHRHHYSGGDYPAMFANLFLKASAIVDLTVFDVTNQQYPDSYDDYDGVIITGSRASAFEPLDWIIRLKKEIQSMVANGHKLIGICFGHQVIAQALGGKVIRSSNGWGVGVQTISIMPKKRQVWMKPFTDHLSLIFYHQDQVIELPKSATLLAQSGYCCIQMYLIEQQVLGIQAHPEMLRSHNHQLLQENATDLKDQWQQAIDSLRVRDHGVIVGQWLVHFLEN